MKQLRPLLLLLFLLPLSLTAQKTILSYDYPDATIRDGAASDDGNYVLGYRVYEEKIGYEIHNFYDGFVAKLDQNLRPVWEKKFPRSKYVSIEAIEAVPGGILVLHSKYESIHSTSSVAHIQKLDGNGQELWSQTMSYPGYNTTEGKWIQPLADGGTLVMTRAYRNENSLGNLWLHRLDANGKKVWNQMLGNQFYHSSAVSKGILQNGKLLVTGFAYPGYSDFKAENAHGWVAEFDINAGGEQVSSQTYSRFKNFIIEDFIELSDGGILAIATFREDLSLPILVQFNRNGSLVHYEKWKGDTHMRFNSICWNSESQTYYLLGSMNKSRSSSKRTKKLVEISPDWQILQDEPRAGASFQRAFALGNGEILTITAKGVELLGDESRKQSIAPPAAWPAGAR